MNIGADFIPIEPLAIPKWAAVQRSVLKSPWDYPHAGTIDENEPCLELREWEQASIDPIPVPKRFQGIVVIRNDAPAIVIYEMPFVLGGHGFFYGAMMAKSVAYAREKAEVMREMIAGHQPGRDPLTDGEWDLGLEELHHEDDAALTARSVSGPHYRKERA